MKPTDWSISTQEAIASEALAEEGRLKEAPSVEDCERLVREKFEVIVGYCRKGALDRSFMDIESDLWGSLCVLACGLLRLLLCACEGKMDYEQAQTQALFASRIRDPSPRTITCRFGKLRYYRRYLEFRDQSGGWHPLDAALGLTADGFSATVISWGAQLATQVSYACATRIIRSFLGFAPSTEAIEAHVLGLGKRADSYMQCHGVYHDDGEILVIETDGKAIPTATESELKKRRGARKKRHKLSCTCQRHRGQSGRKNRGSRKRRKKGDKSKNGRSATLMAMYTLGCGADGKLHGPINKKIWGSFQSRKESLQWLRRQATQRGFPPDTTKRIHVVIDGEVCLQKNLQELFPAASFCLDVRHLEEKIWLAGRTFHKEGSADLEAWVAEKTRLLYRGEAALLIKRFTALEESLKRPRADNAGKKALNSLIGYMSKRLFMMPYAKYRKKDLPISSGIIEGAARYVVGERLDCSGMRWIPDRAEMLLHLRCIYLNGDWDDFFRRSVDNDITQLKTGAKVIIRETKPPPILRFEKKKGKSA